MDSIRVAVVNRAGLDEVDVVGGVAALQRQLRQDFRPVWLIDAELVLVPRSLDHTHWPGHWGLVLLDQRSQGEDWREGTALQFHVGTTSDGHPLRGVTVRGGEDWALAASHGLLEMLVDPDRNEVVDRGEADLPFRFYRMRVCDPCAARSDGYELLGRTVSNFVHPAWFGSATLGNTARFDQMESMRHGSEVRAGGSIGVLDPATSAWQALQSDGSTAPPPVDLLAANLPVEFRVGWAP